MADSPEVNSEQTLSGGDEGSGARNERAESGLTRIRDERLTLRAAKWQRDRWDTGATKDELQQRIADRSGQPTLKELIALKAFEALESKDSRANMRAARTGVQMERMNQTDQLAALNSGTDPVAHATAPAAPDAIALAMDASIPEVAAG